MADPRDRQDDEARILQELIDQGSSPARQDSPKEDEDVRENPDGSATIKKANGKGPPAGKFYRNLAEELPDTELQKISTTLLQLIADDQKAREERDKQYEEGLKRMGLSKETIGGANFTGASVVTHPMYIEACIDFEARSIKEILPATGPCREVIPGTITTEKTDRARRKARWFNYLFLNRMPHFRTDLEQCLMQLAMSGNQYIKFLPPADHFHVEHEWVPVDEMLLPEAATSFYAAERRTHRQKLTAHQFAARIRSGFYRDVAADAGQAPESTQTEEAAAKIEGKESTGENLDGARLVYECDCLFEIPVRDNPLRAGELKPLPYLISIQAHTQEVLAIYRNWDEKDKECTRLEWTAPFDFIPFRGAYALGLPHVIGGLSIAATGALRALLDSAHINNLAGMIKLKGAPGTGQTLKVSPTEIVEIEGSSEVDDIRKLIMPVPFGQPSAVLFQLLGFLDTKSQQVIRTTLDESQDNTNMPVGTQMMRIEQGMVVFSAIHARLHASMDHILKILHRLCATYLDDQDVLDELGEQLVTRADFDGPSDVLPASDPNIFCELQRYGQIQTVAQRAQLLPQVYDLRKVEELILKQLRLPNDGKDLLVSKPEPQQLNPVNENIALALGRPIVAFPEQDHEAHIETHCDFLENPLYTVLVGSTPVAVGALMQHLREHLAFWYGMQVHLEASKGATAEARRRDPKAGIVDVGTLPQNHPSDPTIGQAYDQMLAAAAARVMQQATQNPMVKKASQTIQHLQQMLQKMQPPPPMDPSQALMADTQRKAKRDEADIQLKGQELQQKGQETQSGDASKQQIAALESQSAERRQQEQDATKLQITTQDNLTAQAIASEKALTGMSTNLKDGVGVGKSAPKASP